MSGPAVLGHSGVRFSDAAARRDAAGDRLAVLHERAALEALAAAEGAVGVAVLVGDIRQAVLRQEAARLGRGPRQRRADSRLAACFSAARVAVVSLHANASRSARWKAND